VVSASGGPAFWLRWSWRDLRSHWVAVVTIALVIAIGTGVYAGLSSTSTWRRMSNDASFAAGAMHDFRLTTAPGTFVAEGELRELVEGIPSADQVDRITERLSVDSQLEVATAEGDLLVTSRIVGGTLDDGSVDRVWVRDGTAPEPGAGDAILEAKFADFHGLGEAGTVTLAGDRRVRYQGLGIAPEDFYVFGPEGTVLAEADLGTVYLHLDDAQNLADRPGEVNDVVLTVGQGGDAAAVERDLRAAAAARTDVSLDVTTTDDSDAYRILYEDIGNDQQFFTAFAVLVLVAAALAAFNLINRIVEAQRREIGIGMALGAPRSQLSARPLLIGVQIAVIGVVAGIGVGLLVGSAMKGLLESVLPLPVYRTPFQFGAFAKAAAVGVAIPLVASAWPIWRAVSVEPIEAIRTGHLTARPGRFTNLSRRIHLPGSSLNQIPLRNLLRSPRRTLLTATGVGVAIASLVTVLGMLDSFERTIDRGGEEIARADPDRMIVQLTTFHLVDDPALDSIEQDPAVGSADPGVRLPATVIGSDGTDAFDLVIDSYDFDEAVWSPTVVDRGEGDPFGGILLASKAADDLGVGPGDTVRIRHPARSGGGYKLVESEFVVSGIQPNPIRTFAYIDSDAADAFGFQGTTNVLSVVPSAGTSRAELQRALFGNELIASAVPVGRVSEAFDEALQTFVGFLVVTAVAVLALAVLIAFNAARITVEERRRDHATMRAFGLPVRSIMGVITKESVVIGLVATLVGVVVGTLMLEWMLRSLAARTLPEFGIERYVSPSTLLIAAIVGVVAVTVAPLFLIGRIRKMDLPSTLRVME
jgi:putative ABC transport system permease protein